MTWGCGCIWIWEGRSLFSLLRNSRAPGLPHSRIPARTGLTFAMAGIEIGVCLLCNIFWNFIHDYALFFVKSGPDSDSWIIGFSKNSEKFSFWKLSGQFGKQLEQICIFNCDSEPSVSAFYANYNIFFKSHHKRNACWCIKLIVFKKRRKVFFLKTFRKIWKTEGDERQ